MRHPRIVASFPALGTTATLVLTEADGSETALGLLRETLDRFDRACSRFRTDSELVALNQAPPGIPFPVSDLFCDALEAGLRAAESTEGLVDPTVGTALELIGYDRDISLVAADGPPIILAARAVPGWRAMTLNRSASTVTLRPGVAVDLGATAKALCADRSAMAIAAELGSGVLVSLGGDMAVAGPAPEGGWPVKVTDDHVRLNGPGPVVSISSGGLATSSTTVRRWRRGGQPVHHLIDPATSKPAAEYWRTVSVAAGNCLDANIASCASILLGQRAPRWLQERRLPARLVASDGCITCVAGWPDIDDEAPEGARIEASRC